MPDQRAVFDTLHTVFPMFSPVAAWAFSGATHMICSKRQPTLAIVAADFTQLPLNHRLSRRRLHSAIPVSTSA